MIAHDESAKTVGLTERVVAQAAIGIVGIASAAFAPFDAFFAPNFAFYFGSQLAILALLVFYRPRPAVYAGVALTLSVCFVLFANWNKDALGWVLYVLCMPGPAIGTVLIGLKCGMWQSKGPFFAGVFAAVVTLVCIIANAGALYLSL